MKVGLSSRVDLSCNIKGGWESSTDGGNCVSIASSISVSTSDGWGGDSWGSDGWGGDGWGSNSMSSVGWGSDGSWSMGIANSGEDSSLGSKVVSLSSGNSGLVIGSDSTVGVNPQAKGSSSKSLGTSIASIAVSGGISSTVMASLSGSNGSGNSNLEKATILFVSMTLCNLFLESKKLVEKPDDIC